MPNHDHCCAPLCANRKNKQPDLSFPTFPVCEIERRKWIIAIKRAEGANFKVTANVNTVICSAHFTLENFVRSIAVSGNTSKQRRRLKAGAVPSNSVFAFKTQAYSRPLPSKRRSDAEGRLAEKRERASLAIVLWA